MARPVAARSAKGRCDRCQGPAAAREGARRAVRHWALLLTGWAICLSTGRGLAAEPNDSAGGRRELALLRKLPPEMLRRFRGGAPDQRGYIGHQQQRTEMVAGFQRGGVYTLAMGVALKNPAWIDEGWRVIDATFAAQNADGSIGSAREQPATSAAFFLCWCARAMNVLAASEVAEQYKPQLDAVRPKIAQACRWLATQSDALTKENSHAANRCFIAADAFALSGVFLGDDEIKNHARRYVEMGLKHYRASDGVIQEKGGGDSSYQAVSILALMYYRLYVDEPRLDPILRKAVDWELTRIADDGTVSAEGNTRTGLKQETWQGQFKDINVPEVIQALAYYGVAQSDKRAQDAALRVWKHYDTRR